MLASFSSQHLESHLHDPGNPLYDSITKNDALGSGCCKPKRENDTMGNNIRSSSRPKALAPSIPMPPLADAMSAYYHS